LTLPPILLSLLIAVPVGYLAHRAPRIGGPVLVLGSLMYALPALPLLIVVPTIAGTPLRSSATMVIAMTMYGVALLVRTAADAFGAVDPRVVDASHAIGFGRASRVLRVELPLAVPVIVSGLRVVSSSTIGMVTIGSLIGVSSLGTLLTDGFQRGLVGEVTTGVVATVLLAVVLDVLILLAGRVLVRWNRSPRGRTTTA
jgi:osmoprotectant transport system permease protein